MGYNVHIQVSFACDENEAVAQLAAQHAAAFDRDTLNDASRYAVWFLDDLAARTGRNPGPKGGLSLWGMTGNYARVDEFCELLRPFWLALLAGVEGGPNDFEHVIVFEEREQAEQAAAYEISREAGALSIKRHKLPFAWMQF